MAANAQPAPGPPLPGQDGGPTPVAELGTVEIVADVPAASERAKAAQSTVIDLARFAGESRAVAELLGSSPGVSVHQSGGPGQAATLSLRGASADESLVLLDGIPLQGAGGGAIDLSAVPAALLSRIVVSRGVLGAQLGAGALGGAVELVPAQLARGAIAGGAQLSAGSYGTAQLAADLGAPLGKSGSFTAALQLDRTQGDFAYQRQVTPDLPGAPWYDDARSNADAQRAGALLRAQLAPWPGTELDLLFQGSLGARGLPGPLGSFTPHQRDLDGGGVLGARLRTALANGGLWTTRAWGAGQRIELHGVGSSGFGDCVGGDAACGVELSRDVSGHVETELGLPLGGAHWATFSAGGGREWLTSNAAGRRARSLGSLAAADDWSIGGDAATVHPAVRLDAAGSDVGISPGVGVIFRPFAARAGAGAGSSFADRLLGPLALRAGVGASFRVPSFAELYLDQGGIAPNPALHPEHALSLDAGVRWAAGGMLFSAGAFWSRYRDLILYELYPPARAKPFNVGRARIYGIELEAVIPLPWSMALEGSLTLLRAINEQETPTLQGRALAYRAPLTLLVRAARRGDRIEGYLELAAQSAMQRNDLGATQVPGQAVINAGLGARIAGTLWIDLELKNALDDQRRQDLFQYPLPGLTVAALVRARL